MKTIAALALLLAPAALLAQSTNDAGRTTASNFSGFTTAPDVVSGAVTFTGSEPVMSPRFFRPGVAGDPCSTFSSGNFQYITVPFFADAGGSITANVDPGVCGTAAYVTFHTAPFNPAGVCDNFVFAHGSSEAFTETFAVPASTDMVMVVSGVQNAPGVVCGPVTYQLDGAELGPPAAPAIAAPTLDRLGLGVMILVLGALGAVVLRRRG